MLLTNRPIAEGSNVPATTIISRPLSRTIFLLCCFTFFYSGFNRVSAPATGVVTELLFNEGTGTSTADGSGNGHNGTLTNGPTWVAGKYGQAINFDGTNDYLSIADHANFTLDPTVSYTWSAWVKNNNFNPWGTIWSQTIDVNNFFYFYAHTTSDPEPGPVTNGVTLYWWTNGGTNKVVLHSNNNVLTSGQWSYITITYNAAQPQATRFTIYVNGVDVTNRTDVLSTGTLATINPTAIRMGANAPWGDYLNGAVDEMRYYRRLLSVAEIQADMNSGNTPDTQTPSVSITSPTANSTVSSTVNITANASDNVGVTGVQFKLDGVNLGAEDLTTPYSITWTTSSTTNGLHSLTAIARDAAGNTSTSAAIPVTVNNFVDTESPIVSITAPSTGSTVSSTITINATATDNVAVTGVQFLLDGVTLGAEDVSAPYSFSWNSATASNANHSISARARDAAGNLSVSSPITVTVFNNNLVAAFGFNENNGTVLNDNSGNANHGTLANGPVWTTAGKNGAALRFDGVDDLVNINDANSLDLTNGMTVEAWINPSNLTGYKTVLCKEQNTNNLCYAISANNNTSGAANQRPNTRIRINTTTTTVTGTTKLALNTWTHIASTFDGSTVRFYINGVQVSTANASGNMVTSANLLRIGGSPALGAQYFNGLIDELRIYNRALSASEIQADMNTPVAPDLINPTIAISSPADAATVTGSITVTANASDNIGVVGVQFLIDGANLGAEDVSAPYSTTLNTSTINNGNHILTARARDAAGNSTTSSGINIVVSNDTEAPTISLTAPANNATVAGTIDILADANDNTGIVGVQFLLDGANLGAEDVAAPYSFSWNTTLIPDGNHTLTAKARDAAGNSTTSAPITLAVLNTIPDTESPSVTIAAPATGEVSGNVSITATGSDNTGIVGIQFQVNGANINAEDLVAPYTTTWNTLAVTNGEYTLTAIARDAAGNSATSSPVVVIVNNQPDLEPPTVNITSPIPGSLSGTINLSANANDNIGVSGLQFLVDGAPFGAEILSPPYTISWNSGSVSNGSHTISARVRDAAGNITTSAEVSILVNNDIVSPTVSITAPAAGTVSATVNITASANDNVGVVGVQFLLDGVNLGTEDLSAPFTFSWNTTTASNGSHSLTAKARDAAGNITTSAAINVNVSNSIDLLTALHFNESTGVAVADISGNAHHGTLNNGPTRIAGKYGLAANFDGTNDNLSITDHADYTLNPAQNYTWSAWVKNNNFNAWGTVWSQTIDLNNFFYFYAHSTSDPEAGPVTNGVTVYWWTGGGTNKLVIHSNNNVLTAGQWNFITVTYNASLAQANRFTIYVNGTDVTNRSDVLSTGTLATLNPTSIWLGGNQPWGDYLNGGIDEVRYYKKLQTPAEILTDMNTPLGIDNTPPVVSISSPVAGSTLAGTINLSADASDNFGVTGVQFLVDGVAQGSEDLVAPYAIAWNSANVSNGTHTITAIARDAAGNSSTSPPISITIAPDFSFVPQTNSVSLGTTGSANVNADISFLNGFSSSNITLTVSGAPAGVTAAYSINPMTDQGTVQLMISTNNATPGVYPLSLTATANSITHTQQLSLVINGVADFSVTPTPLSQNVVAGNSISYSIALGETGDFVNPVTLSIQGLPAGVTASFNPASPVPAATSTLTLTTTTAVVNGTYTLTVRGVSGALTRTADITLTVSSIPPSSLSLPPGFSVINVGGGAWDQPMGTVFTKDGEKMFVWEKKGTVYVCTRNAQQLYDRQAAQVLNIESEVGNWGDHGLMSIALDPVFSSSTGGYIYLLYVVDRRFLLNDNSIPADQGFEATIGRITRYKVINSGGNLVIDASPAERKILLGETKETGIPILHDSHGLGTILFAEDGTLIASAGDGASYLSADLGGDAASYYVRALSNGIIRTAENVGAFRAQLLNSHNGKILRMDPATGDGLPSNPYYNAAAPRSPRSRVWALGLRNPFRITIRPGSGSTNPAAGDVGDIYVGDVGWNTWEELNIIDEPGMNCGWPLFEGLNAEPTYSAATTLNQDEPNPLGCSAFFQFRQLLKQATADGITTVFNPCNTSIAIPGSTSNNRFYHRRPSMEWKHGADIARVGIFTGNTADVATIGTPGSGVTGTPFRGNSSTGGCWYTGTLFPAQYRNTYFQGDYGAQWMKDFRVDFTDVVQEVQNFASGFGAIISMTENPTDGTIYCIDLGDNTVKRISYGGNQFPVVKMSSDKTYGPSALGVSFTGSNSFDPEGSVLTYSWNFGDNTTSTLANPVHNFTSSPNTVSKYVVKLTVKDNQNATATDSIIISVNNTPPVVTITSPVNNSLYKIGPDTSYTCSAIVTDTEHSPGQLKYQWQTFLRHNNHEHPAPIDTTRNTSTFLARVGCNGDEYSYFIRLTVTDAGGLSTVDSVKIFPDCSLSRGINQEELVGVERKLQEINNPMKMADVADGLVVSPNPVTGPFRLNYVAPSAGDVIIRITDMNGKLVNAIRRTVSKGFNSLSIQSRMEWTSGTYLVAVVQGKRVRKGKFLFQGVSK